jgi:ribonuclease III
VTDLVALQERLGYRFRSAELLRLAMTHPSVVNDVGTILQTNQRLEFLGDAVLQLILTRELFDRHPRHGEGPLTKFRAKLVNRRMLAQLARELGLDQQLILSPGEEATGGRLRGADRRVVRGRRVGGGARLRARPVRPVPANARRAPGD